MEKALKKANGKTSHARTSQAKARVKTVGNTAFGPVTGAWLLLLGFLAVVTQAAAAFCAALAVVHGTVMLPRARNGLYNILAAETGYPPLHVLTLLLLISFVCASISKFADHWVARSMSGT